MQPRGQLRPRARMAARGTRGAFRALGAGFQPRRGDVVGATDHEGASGIRGLPHQLVDVVVQCKRIGGAFKEIDYAAARCSPAA